MALPLKPVEGSWTEHYPDLGTGLVSYRDSTSPEFHELERDAIWKRAWLNLGRVEQLPRTGSYFTKELAVAKTSIIVVRDKDGEVRAFHNICRHRGNKLVWQDFPRQETSGTCRQFVCKYHGWQYDLDGGCTFVQQESEFFDLDKADYGLVPVHCDVWAGFIFVNLDREPRQSLREFLGPMITAMDDYPFHLMTERFSYTTEIYSNWKIYLDAFQEFYHASILHSQQQVPSARTDPPAEFYGAHYQIDGPHRVVSTSGWQGVPRHLMPPERMYPMEHATGSGVLGPWHRPELGPEFDVVLDDPPGVNPGNVVPWGISNFQIFPNIELLVYERGWYLTYHYWPTSQNTHIWEGTYYFVPSASVRERVQHEVAAVMSKDYALQDAGTLAGTQLALESDVLDRFPLCDQEITVRHFHKVVGDWVDDYRHERGNGNGNGSQR
jgi:phenylpropionate dioxygenase-like ring-hydroxylating dioxygenase large terminal subunit